MFYRTKSSWYLQFFYFIHFFYKIYISLNEKYYTLKKSYIHFALLPYHLNFLSTKGRKGIVHDKFFCWKKKKKRYMKIKFYIKLFFNFHFCSVLYKYIYKVFKRITLWRFVVLLIFTWFIYIYNWWHEIMMIYTIICSIIVDTWYNNLETNSITWSLKENLLKFQK